MPEVEAEQLRAAPKVVHCAPALSARATNLLYLHDRVPRQRRRDVLTLDADEDRTLFLDLHPFMFMAPGGLRANPRPHGVSPRE